MHFCEFMVRYLYYLAPYHLIFVRENGNLKYFSFLKEYIIASWMNYNIQCADENKSMLF